MRNTPDGKRTRKRPFLLPGLVPVPSIPGFSAPPTRDQPSVHAAPIPASHAEGELPFPLPVDLLGALLERLGGKREG